MDMKIMYMIIIGIVLIPVSTYAQDVSVASSFTWDNTCLDNDTLLKEIIFEVDGTPTILNQTLNCSFGCEAGLGKYGADCIEPEYIITLWVIGGIIGLFILIVIAIGRRRR